jgi:hypothetical protein
MFPSTVSREPDPVTESDIQTLLAFISAPKPGNLTDGEWEERVNVILDLLRRQTEDVETEDRRQEVSSGRFQVSSGEDGAGGGELQGQIQNPSANPSPTSASPRFVSDNDDIDWGRVDEILEGASRRLVGEAGAGADVRISAIHACVDRKDAEPLPDLRKIAADKSLVSTLRKAAIHAIGQLGTVEDLSLLDSLPQDDGNLSMAVGPARIALKSRTTGVK